MPTRRHFLKSAAILTGSLSLARYSWAALYLFPEDIFTSKRPAIKDRKFTSEAVERQIATIKKAIVDPGLAWMFENCYPNTLDTTIMHHGILNGKEDTFVITGDIPAMWLRDSTAQIMPYVRYVKEDKPLNQLVRGVINRQIKCVLIDPYANAFNYDASEKSYWYSDETEMKPELHERKWEVDSLCHVIRLSHEYWKITGDLSLFDNDWTEAMHRILITFREQQRKSGPGPYHFQRKTTVPTDTLTGGGYGAPANPNGMICSMFRPSDDATTQPYLIPSNFFAVVSLTQLAMMMEKLGKQELAKESSSLADEILSAIKREAIIEHPGFGQVYAYEIDGYGNHIFMDDANMPSLLSLPYLGAVDRNDKVYQNTRKLVLSSKNPYFFQGISAKGIGSPHTKRGNIWPLSLITQILTSEDDGEIVSALTMLKQTHAGTGFMHESFNPDQPKDYTRSWFAWANTLFGEMVVKLYEERPKLLNAE